MAQGTGLRCKPFSEDTVSPSFEGVEAVYLRAVPSTGHSGAFLFISEITLSLSHKDLAVQNVLRGPAAPGAVSDSQTPLNGNLHLGLILPFFGGVEDGTEGLIHAKEVTSHRTSHQPRMCILIRCPVQVPVQEVLA